MVFAGTMADASLNDPALGLDSGPLLIDVQKGSSRHLARLQANARSLQQNCVLPAKSF